MKQLPLLIIAFVTVLAVSHSVFYYPILPDPMASHFDGAGSPNGWSSKTGFFAVAVSVLALNLFVFLVIPIVTSRRTSGIFRLKRPKGSEGTRFRRFFRTRLLWFGIINLVFGIAVMHMVFAANLRSGRQLDSRLFIAVLVAYFVLLIVWLFLFFRAAYRLPDKTIR